MLLLVLSAGCTKTSDNPGEDPDPDPKITGVHKYVTTADKKALFKEETYDFGAVPDQKASELTINKDTRYQTIDGFGGALTGASCFNLLQMDGSVRTAFLKEVFDPVKGLGSSLIRVSIGASDFSVNSEFTWCDTKGLDNFRIPKEDEEYLIPILKEIYKINPGVKIIASPWSAPRWMKTELSWTKAGLNAKFYDDYAQYFVMWIQTMESFGFNIHAITVQNEPLNKGNSMSMYMPWQEQRDFVKLSLGKAFAEAGLKTKVLIYDHNYNYDGVTGQRDYPLNILADPDAEKYIAGSAWHNYNSGDVNELANIVKSAPGKDIYFTEASIGTWNEGPNHEKFGEILLRDFENVFMATMNYSCKGVTLWNLLLDTSSGPHRPGGCFNCFGLATFDPSTKKISLRNSHYYDLAHASKVVRPGAVRIDVRGSAPSNVKYQAFLNTDGTIGMLFLNNSNSSAKFLVKSSKEVYAEIPARSIASLIWDENGQ